MKRWILGLVLGLGLVSTVHADVKKQGGSGSGMVSGVADLDDLAATNAASALDLVTYGTGGKITYSTPLTNVMQTTSTDTKTAPITFSSTVTFSGPVVETVGAITIADNGGGTAAAYTFDATATAPAGKVRAVKFTCNDANGCAITMSETGVTEGTVVKFYNVSAANSVTWADTSGVQELAGAFTQAPLDVIELEYVVDRWFQNYRSDN